MKEKKYLKFNKELMREWDFDKNKDIDLENITEGMGISVWWKCSVCNYEWKTRINHRTKDNTGCPICRKIQMIEKQKNQINERIKKENLTITNPEIIKEWNYERNEYGPEKYLAGMGTSVWWKCSVCEHEWKTRINHRTKDNTKCPNCSKQEIIENIIRQNGSFADNYPELLNEWAYDKNKKIDPCHVTQNTKKIVWWRCSKCNYEWKTRIVTRAKGAGCPKCARIQGNKTLITNLIKEKGSLAENRPDICSEWNYEKNDFMPSTVMTSSNVKVWWKCSVCNYEWKMDIAQRTLKNGRCPKCLRIEKGLAKSTPILGVNDLLSQNSILSKEWNYEKNGNLKPEDVTVSSNKKVWWLGKCGHEWEATIGSRTLGRGCPICLKEYKISFPEKVIFFYLRKTLKNFDVQENYHPEFLKQKELDIAIPSLKVGIEYDGYNWHKSIEVDKEKDLLCEKNLYKIIRIRENKCEDYKSNSLKIYYNEKNEKELKNVIIRILEYISFIINKKFDLDFDLDRDRTQIYELMEMVKKDNSLSNLFPEVLKEWNYEKNGKIKPEYVSAHTHKKMWWKCPKGHEYQMEVKHKTEDNCKCPICSSHRVLAGFNDLATISPNIAKEWDYEKNGDLKPTNVMNTSNMKVWWKCSKGHSYLYSISHRTKDGRTCPICSNRQVLKGYNDLISSNKEICQEWNYEKNQDSIPEDFTPISGKKVWWRCSLCNHEWDSKISNRFIKGNGCPKCAGNKRWKTIKEKNIKK